MLGKLMKYEFRATARLFLPMYLLLIVLAGINRLFLELSDNQMFHLFEGNRVLEELLNVMTFSVTMLYVLGVLALFILTFVIFIYRFYRNLLGDEGYLMMTLPVTANQNLWAKLHTSVIWSVASFVVCILSLCILLLSPSDMDWIVQIVPNFFQEFLRIDSTMMFHLICYGIEFVILMIASLYANVIFYYACLAIGHRLSRKHRLLSAIGAYLILSFILQIVSTILFVIFGVSMDTFFPTIAPELVLHIMLIGMILLSVVEWIVFFFITSNTLHKHLNLE